jgi:hypothetical protein
MAKMMLNRKQNKSAGARRKNVHLNRVVKKTHNKRRGRGGDEAKKVAGDLRDVIRKIHHFGKKAYEIYQRARPIIHSTRHFIAPAKKIISAISDKHNETGSISKSLESGVQEALRNKEDIKRAARKTYKRVKKDPLLNSHLQKAEQIFQQ